MYVYSRCVMLTTVITSNQPKLEDRSVVQVCGSLPNGSCLCSYEWFTIEFVGLYWGAFETEEWDRDWCCIDQHGALVVGQSHNQCLVIIHLGGAEALHLFHCQPRVGHFLVAVQGMCQDPPVTSGVVVNVHNALTIVISFMIDWVFLG